MINNNIKHFEIFYKGKSAEILVNGIICYKIIYSSGFFFLTDINKINIARIEMCYNLFVFKNIVKVYYLNSNQIVKVDKNFWGNLYIIKIGEREKLKFTAKGDSYFFEGQKLRYTINHKLIRNFYCKIDFFYQQNVISEMIFITLFYQLRIVDP